MPIDLYPNISKVKRNGAWQNLPGFVPQSGDADIKAMIANSESSTTSQYVHPEGSYFILNDVLYKAIIDIAINDTIAVGTNCEVAILCDDVSDLKTSLKDQFNKIDKDEKRLQIIDGELNLNNVIEIGNIAISNNGWIYSSLQTRARTAQGITIPLKNGDTIHFADYSTIKYYVGWKLSNNIYGSAGWLQADYTVLNDGDYVLCIETIPQATINLSEIINRLTITVKSSQLTNIVENSSTRNSLKNYWSGFECDLLSGKPYKYGYIAGNGNFTPIATTNPSHEITYENIKVYPGNVYLIKLRITGGTPWLAVAQYDSSNNFISRQTQDAYTTDNTYYYQHLIYACPYNVDHISLSARTRGYDTFKIEMTTDRPEYKKSINVGSNIKSIAHRGAEFGAPENTPYAFVLAKKLGFEYVETDVTWTSDKVAVLLHDTTINRTARNADGTTISEPIAIGDITYEQANIYDYGIWKGEKFSGVGIPTFENFVTMCKKIGLHPYIEIKPNMIVTSEMVDNLVNIIKRNGMTKNITWISTADNVLDAIAEEMPKTRLGWLADVNDTSIAWCNNKIANGYEAFIDCNATYITTEKCQTCANNDIPLEAWTLTNANQITLLDKYISGVTSNTYMATVENLRSYDLDITN